MSETEKTEQDHILEARSALLKAALPHVVFDGWSADTLEAAVEESGVDAGLAAQACPRGGIDLAVAFHKDGDAKMLDGLTKADMSDMRFRDKVAFAVKLRLEAAMFERDAVRKGASLFALPQNLGDGASLVWGTCDAIWTALGDTSDDVNWYTKRASLSGVYSSTVLFWLGDDSEGFADTWSFLDRRIENVMSFESFKAKVQTNPLVKSFMAGPGRIFEHVKAPKTQIKEDLPGYTRG